MGKNKLFPFFLQKELTCLFVNIESHLLLPNYGYIALNNFVMPDDIGERLQVLKKNRLHNMIAYSEGFSAL